MRDSLRADSTEPAPIARRPSLVNSLFEFRFPVEAAALFWSYAIHHPRPHVDDSNRKTVMMIPGFMAGDLTLVNGRIATGERPGAVCLPTSKASQNPG